MTEEDRAWRETIEARLAALEQEMDELQAASAEEAGPVGGLRRFRAALASGSSKARQGGATE